MVQSCRLSGVFFPQHKWSNLNMNIKFNTLNGICIKVSNASHVHFHIHEMILQASYKHTSGGRRLKLVCLNVSRDDTTEKAALW